MYWDIKRTLSYNCLFNFIVGNRGGGKTYGFKKWAIDDFLKTGAQFVYVRRYKQELKRIKTYFDDITEVYPEHELSCGRDGLFKIDGEIAGYPMPLSTAKIEKSTAFPNVNKLCFDEFILDRGVYHYLPDEVTAFLELYETIARMRDVRCFFMSNAITITNPYFAYFNIDLPYGSNIKRYDDILIELVNNEEFIESKFDTRFGKIIKGTQYGEYNVENKFLRDSKYFVEKRSKTASYLFTFIYMSEKYGVWSDNIKGLVWVSDKVDPTCPIIFSFTTDDHKPNTMLIHGYKRNPHIKFLIDNFELGNVRFESVNIKNITLNALRMCV